MCKDNMLDVGNFDFKFIRKNRYWESKIMVSFMKEEVWEFVEVYVGVLI